MPAEKKTQRYTFKGAAGEYVYAADFDRVTAEREALQELLNQRDEALHDLEQRRHAEQQACQAAERRVGDLELSLMWVRSQLNDQVIVRFIDIALNPTAEAASHE